MRNQTPNKVCREIKRRSKVHEKNMPPKVLQILINDKHFPKTMSPISLEKTSILT